MWNLPRLVRFVTWPRIFALFSADPSAVCFPPSPFIFLFTVFPAPHNLPLLLYSLRIDLQSCLLPDTIHLPTNRFPVPPLPTLPSKHPVWSTPYPSPPYLPTLPYSPLYAWRSLPLILHPLNLWSWTGRHTRTTSARCPPSISLSDSSLASSARTQGPPCVRALLPRTFIFLSNRVRWTWADPALLRLLRTSFSLSGRARSLKTRPVLCF